MTTLVGNTVKFDYGANRDKAMKVAFPEVDPGVTPFGSRVLVQYRVPKDVTAGGIILPQDVQETEIWNTQVAKVLALGPLAFKNREKGTSWVEGSWVKPGDFVRVPKHGGDKWTVKVRPGDGWGSAQDEVLLALWNDLDLLARIDGDPLTVRAYL